MPGNIVREIDRPIVEAFCRREASQFLWVEPDAEEKYAQKLITQLMDYTEEEDPEFDYIKIQSLTNMGLLESELVLSAQKYKLWREIHFIFPPSPKSKISVHVVENTYR